MTYPVGLESDVVPRGGTTFHVRLARTDDIRRVEDYLINLYSKRAVFESEDRRSTSSAVAAQTVDVIRVEEPSPSRRVASRAAL